MRRERPLLLHQLDAVSSLPTLRNRRGDHFAPTVHNFRILRTMIMPVPALPSRLTHRRPPMPDLERKSSLLEELEQRQDEVIAQLDELNSRIESLLNECLQTRKPELRAAEL